MVEILEEGLNLRKYIVFNLIFIIGLISISSALASNTTKQNCEIGPYNISFKLVGERNLEVTRSDPEIRETKAYGNGTFYEMTIHDTNTEEYVELTVVRYTKPVKVEKNLDDTDWIATGQMGEWFVSTDFITGLFIAMNEVDDYTSCRILSSFSRSTTEELFRTIQITNSER
jgi:hypothetical protein